MSGKRYPKEFKIELLTAIILFPALQHVSISPRTA